MTQLPRAKALTSESTLFKHPNRSMIIRMNHRSDRLSRIHLVSESDQCGTNLILHKDLATNLDRGLD